MRGTTSAAMAALGFVPDSVLPAWATMALLALFSLFIVLFEFYASRVRVCVKKGDQCQMEDALHPMPPTLQDNNQVSPSIVTSEEQL